MEATRFIAVLLVGPLLSVTAVEAFYEGWENAPIDVYVPIDVPAPIDAAFIHGDEGWWNLNDSIAGNPECGPTPNRGEILMYEGSKALRLYSGFSYSDCADKVWVALRDFGSGYNTDFAIPIDSDTMISFDETGGLFSPSPDFTGWWPPYFESVSLQLADNRDNLLIYVLQRHPGAQPDDQVLYYGVHFWEVFLDPGAGSHTRNVFDDFSMMSGFDPVDAQIVYIEFQVDEHGWAILDNLSITDTGGGWPALDIDWIAMTSAKDFHDGVPDGVAPWFFEIWVTFVECGALHHIDVTKPSESAPFATIYYDGDAEWDYDSPSDYASLADLQADYPPGTYTLEFRTMTNLLLRTVHLDYSGLPGEPANPANFTFPSTDGQTGVRLNPTLTWTVAGSDGDALMMELEDSTDGLDVAFEAPVGMGTTSWAVGPLQGAHEHCASVSVCRVKDWVGPDWPVMTVGTDQIRYSLMIEYLNEISFWTANHTPVHRFWKPSDGTHFYTVKESEKNKLIYTYSHIYTYEGPVYYAYIEGQQPAEARPVYRFWKAAGGTHFYTMKESEADKLINDYPHIYTFEGPVFYAYAEGEQPAETQPVYRFWKQQGNTHFYTIKESEKDKLINNYSHIYTYEGAVWYAYE